MRPTQMSTTSFLVAAFKGRQEVAEFTVEQDHAGHWQVGVMGMGPGQVADLAAATAKLKGVLGQARSSGR